MTWKKRIISIVLCLCALLCAASVQANAEDAAATHTDHLVCGGTSGTTCTHAGDKHTSSQTWTAWDGTGSIQYTDNVAYIYLSDDVTLQINDDVWGKPKSLDVGNGKTLYLCLNGHSLTNRGSNTICVYGTLVLCDCKGGGQNNGTITHTKDTDGSFTGSEGIYVDSGAAFIMYGGTISENNGGVQAYKGTFTMYGGKISDNASRGVLVSGGTFTMYGGEISHNTCITESAEGGGGVWVKNGGSNIGNFTMYGGTICKNTYKGIGNCGGGGVYASGTGNFIIQGGKITNNQCSYNATNTSNGASGGGLYISGKPRELKIENCTISNNTCDGEGGGIFINCANVIGTITGCTISGNEAGGKGGGFASQYCTLTIGNCNITNNRTAGKGGAMAVGSWGEDSKITLSGSMNFSGNAQGCTAGEDGKLTGDTANDVHLNTRSVYLRLADDFSKTSTAIVVTTASEPNNRSTVKIAEGSASAAKATDFTYENDSNSTIGIIAKTNDAGKVELLACKHNYSTQKDETNHWQKCSICGDKKDVTAHQYNQEKAETGCLKTAATCTDRAVYYKSCVCGARGTDTFEFGEKLAHTYDKEVATETYLKSAATCTDRAVYYKSCVCGARGTDTFEFGEKLAHTYDKEVATETYLKSAATCTDRAVYYKSCVCGEKGTETFESGETNPDKHAGTLGGWQSNDDGHWKEYSCCQTKVQEGKHTWNKGEVTTSPTCTAAGVKTYTCAVCSAKKTEEIQVTGHAWDTEWSKDNDHHWHKCKNANCDAVKDKAAHAWDEGAVTTPATCTAAGVKTYTCAACSATKKETILATGHAWDAEWSKDNDHHWHKCKNCDAITDLTAHVPGAAATETTPQLCTECGYVIAPATHPVHTWVFVAETPATCNAVGEREHYKCTCGQTSFKNGDVYDINKDASVLTIEKNSANHTGAPDSKWHSDSANHWQEYTCCHARANEAAHSGGAATCTAQAVCQVCGKAYGPLAAHDWQPATCTAPKTCSVCHTTEGTALGHAWQPATCTEPKTCSVCDVTEGAALAHAWGAWKVTTPATKDAPGVETRTCAHNSAHTETRSIPKLSTAVYTVSEDTKIAQIEAKVDGLDKILESNENKALINDGKSVGVSLTVKNTASSGVSEKIKEKLAGSNLVGLRLELTVEKTVTANGVVESKQTIPDAGVLLKTTITLPAELQGKSGYVVYRLHGDAVHVLTETANENGEFISISADKTQITICARLYSEYVIAYQTGGSSGGGYHPVNPTPVKATSANTGDAGVLLYGVTAALSLTGTAWLGAKSRKH